MDDSLSISSSISKGSVADPTIEGWGGELSRIGIPAEDEDIGVRPAVWIDLSKK